MTRIGRRAVIVLLAQAAVLAGLSGAVDAAAGRASVEASTSPVARARLGLLLLPVSVRCSVPKNAVMQVAEVYIAATQRAGGPHEVNAQLYRDGFVCDGRKRTKIIAVTPSTEAGFGRGKASVSIDAHACWWPPGESQSTCVTDSVIRTAWVKYGGLVPPAVTGGTFPLSIASSGHVRQGVATVRVRHRCTMPDAADDLIGEIGVTVRQQAGRRSAALGFATVTDLTCDGSAQRVRVSVPSSTERPFRPGSSVVHLDGYAAWFDLETDDEGWVDGFVDAAGVRLKAR
jgi:hypothetical protein